MFGPGPLSLAELSSHIRYLPEDSALARSLAAEQGQLPADTVRWITHMRLVHTLLDVTIAMGTQGKKSAPPLSHFLAIPTTAPDQPAENTKPRTLREWARALAPLSGAGPPPDPT